MSTKDSRGSYSEDLSEDAGREDESAFLSLHARYGSEIITVLGSSNSVLYESGSVEKLLGYKHAEEVSPKGDWFRYVHPEDVEKLGEAVEKCVATPGESAPVEFRIRHADGEWRWLESRGINLLDDPEVGGVVVSTREITDRKKAEKSLRLKERAMDASSNGVILTDATLPENPIIHVNPTFEKITGYTAEEARGRNCRFLRDMDEDQPCLSELRRAVEEGREWSGILHNYRKDGTSFWNELYIAPVFEGDGRLTNFIGIQQDVTEQMHIQRALRESERRLRAVAEGAPVIFFAFDKSGEITFDAGRGLSSLGLAPGSTVGLSAFELYKDDPFVLENLHRALAGEEVSDTVELEGTSGKLYFDTLYSPLWDVDGEVEGVVGVATDVTDRRNLEDRLKYQALHDSLTGLPGRELLTDRLRGALAEAGREEQSVAVLFVDVDDLKLINDTLGHEAGDRLLCDVGERLLGCVREEDTVARISGDEFVVLLGGDVSEEDALLAAGRILRELEDPMRVNGYEMAFTASIGVAMSPSASSFGRESARELIRHADAAMYRAKSSGGNGYSVYSPEMDREDLERLALTSDLRQAIEREELRVYYQHKVDLSTGKVSGWEALLRWEHPERGTVMPETFIPIAEQTDLIVQMGRWVLERACEQAGIWRERYPKEPAQFMSVNLSARQFQDPALEGEIETILQRTGLPAEALDLEITESVLLSDEDSEFARVRDLKELGLSFSLDDFGTGYSSLLSLKELPVDFVKIDRAFTERVPGPAEEEAFVTSMVTLARALNLKVVAEGIETAEQWARLLELGCDYGQGYYFAPPLPSGEATCEMDRLESTDFTP